MAKRIITASRKGESILQDEICHMLVKKGWYNIETHGNMYQSGLPDVFSCNTKFGQRWVEVKMPVGYSFTPAQMETFPKLCANGSGVWILTAATDSEYLKLFKPYNWYIYLL